jgi:hypothetical protein
VKRGSNFCFVVVVAQNTAALAIFVQFHHASPESSRTLGRQLIGSYITGQRPAAICMTFTAVGRQHIARFLTNLHSF